MRKRRNKKSHRKSNENAKLERKGEMENDLNWYSGLKWEKKEKGELRFKI